MSICSLRGEIFKDDFAGNTTKGKLISKCPLMSSNLPKNQRNVFQDFCPSL